MDLFSGISTALVGILCIVIGILNTKGNVKMLHSYHIKRVKPEDILPFGKLVGLGMIILGLSIVVFSIFALVAFYIEKEILVTVGMVIMAIGIVVGMGLAFYAMKKYNKGIF